MHSEFDDTMDHNVRICPYCKETYQPEGEDYTEDPYEEECGECGKKYWAWENFTVTHWASPDCELNGEEHDYEFKNIREKRVPFCKTCDKIGPIDSWEKIDPE